MTCPGSFFRSHVYLVRYRGRIQLKDSEFKSWDLAPSYAIVSRVSPNFFLQASKTIIKESHFLVTLIMGDVPA